MDRSQIFKRCAWLLLSLSLFSLLIPWPQSLAARPPAPGDAVQDAWQRVQEVGEYRFSSEVVETTHPGPALTNVGRTSRQEYLYLEGTASLPQDTLQMTLWEGEGSLANHNTGVEILIAGDEAQGRQLGGDWQEIPDFSGAFAPGKDLMGYLAGAENVREVGVENHVLDITGEAIAVEYTHYSFSINGRDFAAYMRDQMESYLSEKGELPVGVSLGMAETYMDMTGEGHLWIDNDGLPGRLQMAMTYPEMENGDWVEAEIKTDFFDFPASARATATLLENPRTWLSSTTRRLSTRLDLPRNPAGWQRFGVHIGLTLACIGLISLLFSIRRTRRLYPPIAFLIIIASIVSPVLQSNQVAAYNAEQYIRQQTQTQEKEQADARSATEDALYTSDWNPHANPEAKSESAKSELRIANYGLPASSIQYPASSIQHPASSIQHPASNPDPTSDADNDGLTYEHETNLGTDPDDADSDGDGLSDLIEVRGFSYGGHATWYSDPNNPDTNNDGRYDGLECPQRRGACPGGQCPTLLATPCQDSDKDGTPDLFDDDDDNDEVEDRVDMAPLTRNGPFNAFEPFKLKVESDAAGKPLIVDIQLRPTDAAHLTYARNVLDWPSGDQSGQIQRRKGNNSTFGHIANPQPAAGSDDWNGDMRLVPMLEIEMSGKDIPLPLTSIPAQTLSLSGNLKGDITLTHRKSGMASVTDIRGGLTTGGTYTLDLYAGMCMNNHRKRLISFSGTSNSTVNTWNQALTKVADSNHSITVIQGSKSDCVDVYDIPNGPYEDQMFDTRALQEYAISVQDKDANTVLAYVPLNMVPDQSGGGRVAFAARMLYQQSRAEWGKAHAVRLVWWVQMLTDMCQPVPQSVTGEAAKKWCDDPTHWIDNQPQVVVTYEDTWTLTGISVREDERVDIGIVYPMTDRAQLLNENMWKLAYGLEKAFVAPLDVNPQDGQRDITITTIAQRFDRDHNSAVSDQARWGIPRDAFKVATYTYNNLDYIMSVPMTHTKAILADFATTDTPTLMFVREEQSRALTSDDAQAAWESRQTLNLKVTGIPLSTVAGFQWATYRHTTGQGWTMYPLDEYTDKLSYALQQHFAGDPEIYDPNHPEIMQGIILVSQFYALSVCNGITALVQQGTTRIQAAGIPAEDSTIYTAVTKGGGIVKSVGATVAKQLTDVLVELGEIALDQTGSLKNRLITIALIFIARKAINVYEKIKSGVNAVKTGINAVKTGLKVAAALWKALASASKPMLGLGIAGAIIGGIGLIGILAVNAGIVGTVLGLQIAFSKDALDAFSRILTPALKLIDVISKVVDIISKSVPGVGSVIALIFSTVIALGVAVVQFIILLASGVNGSVALSALGAGLASAMAGLVLGIIGLLLACTGVGLILLAIVAVIDFLVTLICSMLPAGAQEWIENTATVTHGWVNLCGGISGLLTRAATWGIYSNVKIVTVDDPNRLLFTNFDLYPITPLGTRGGFTAGNFLNVKLSLRNNLYLTDVGTRIGASWMAMTLGWWQYNLAALRWSTFKYVLSPNDKADVSVGTNQHYMEWRSSATGSNVVFGDFVNYDPGQWYITRDLSAPAMPLTTAGINRSDFKMYLVEGYSVYLQECINGIPIFPIGLIPICYVRPEWGARPLPLGDGLIFDIFPATLDAFYQRVAKDGGYALAWSGSAALPFLRLKDADGDGLLNTADGGADPNDLLWDTDGDGLSDFFETQQGTNPVSADADGDGLNDRRELVLGTAPFRTDSDGDGLSDKAELAGWAFIYGFDAAGQPLGTWVTSDPIKADTDGDTLLDGREKIFGFNPRVVSDPTVLEFNTTLTENAAPQVLLRFEDYYGATSFSDLSGYSHSATCTGDACPSAGVDGQHGAALSFDGVNDHVDISDAADLHANTFTLAAWFQWDGVGTNAIQFLTGKATENLEIHTGGGNAADVNNIRVIPAGASTILDVPNFIQPGWNHIAVTYDGSTTTVYRNGAQRAQHTHTGAANDLTADSAPLRLGMRGIGAYPFAGDLDEVVVFNRVLSPSEIQTVMNARYTPNDNFVKPGDTFHYEGTVENRLYDRYAQGLLNLSPASQATFDMTPRNFILGPRETTTPPLSGDIRVQTNATSDRLHLTQIAGALINGPDEGRRYQYAFQPSLYLSLDDAPGSAHFQDSTGTAIAQCQGAQCPATGVRGRVNQAAWFDGQDDFVRSDTYAMSSDWGQLGKHAISLWFKTEQGNGTLLKLYGSADDSAILKQTLYLQNGQLCTTLTNLPVLCAPGAYADGQWHHVAYHFLWGFNGDQTDINMTHALYIDGQNPAQAQYSGIPLWEANTIPVLVRTDIGANFQGTLDEIAIYMGLIDTPQLTTLYQAAPQFHLYLDEPLLTPQGITTTTFVDAAHSNHGVCGGGNPAAASCPNAGGEGQINLAANFDGVDDSLTVPPITFNTGTVSLWYNAKIQRDGATAWIGGDNLFIGKRSANEWGGYWCGAWHTVATSALGNTTGAWNHLVFLFAGTDTYIFINGKVVDAITTGACDKTITMIGNSPAVANTAFNGRLDEITVYNRGLTFEEIAAIYQYQNAWVDEQKTVTVRVDADAPVTTISSLPNGAYRRDADVVFQIDAYDPVPASGAPSAGLFKVEWRVNGGAWQEAPACRDAEPGTAWCPTFTPTGEGAYTLEARGVDAVNNEGAPASVNIYVDATPPQATSTTAAGSLLTVQPHPTDAQAWTLALAGSVSDPALSGGAAGSGVASVLVTLQDATGAVVNEPAPATLAGNTWAVAYTLPDAYATGHYTLTTTTADAAGNRTSAALTTFNLDASAPSATLDATTLAPRALSDAQPPALIPGQALAFDLNDTPGARIFQDSSGHDRDATCDGDACPTAGTAGRMAGALDFDGADDTVTVAGANIPKLSQFTISAWFQWDAMGTNTIQFLTARGLENLEIQTGGDAGVNGIRIIPAGYPETNVDVPNFIQPGWNHIAVTYDGSTTTVYRNGALMGERTSITAGNNLTTDTSPFTLGNRSGGQHPFDGRLDEVYVFDRALTAAEVAYLAQAPTGIYAALHLPLDENAGSAAFNDQSGNANHGTCTGATCPVAGVNGKYATALAFDGLEDSLTIADSASLRNPQYTLSAWFQWDAMDTAAIQFLTAKGLGNLEIQTGGEVAGTNGIRVIPAGYPATHVDVADFIQPGWNHIAVTYDGTTTRVYRNGVLVGERTGITGGNNLLADTSPFRLGIRGDGSYRFDGALDDVRLYPTILTPAEIAQLANTLHGAVSELPSIADTVLHLPFEDQAGATFRDLSGQDHDATCSGTTCPTTGTTGQDGAALTFDGADDVLFVADAANLRNPAFTLSAWFQWDDVGAAQTQFLTAKGLENLEIQTGGAGVNSLRIIPAGYPETHVDVANFIQPGWNHVAVTYDGEKTAVYRNGVLVGERNDITGGNDLTTNTSPLRLGQRVTGESPFDGALDDVRLFSRALTAAEVAQLAQAQVAGVSSVDVAFEPTMPGSVFYTEPQLPGQRLYLQLDDMPGQSETLTFKDVAGLQWDGTCSGDACPSTGAVGHTGQGVAFDGVNDTIALPQTTTFLPTAFSLSMWFQWNAVGTDAIQFLTGKGLGNLEIHTGGAVGVNGLRAIPAGYPGTHVDVADFIQPGWNHVVVTYDGTTTTVYRNGAQVAQRTGITGGNDLTLDTSALRLSGRSTDQYLFDGVMDDVRLFDRALTAAEAAALWRGSAALLHLTFDDARIATGDPIQDSSGWQHNGALLSASGDVLHSTTGHVGNGALTFDGVDDTVEIADTPALRPPAYTLSAWFQWDDVGTNNIQFLTGKTPGNFEIQTGGGNAADVNNIRVIPAGYPASYIDVANFIQPGWNHIAVTYDGGLAGFGATVRVYRNGVLAGERTGILGANDLNADTAPFRLGMRGDGSYPFNGALDDVQLYPRVLSEAEIQAQVMRGWQAATVSKNGAGVSRSSWSLVLPQGLEGSYRVAARGADVFGQTDARALAQWEGAIDTLAPRVKADALSLGYATRYTGYAEDFNLDAASYHGPCPTTRLTRQTFAAPWYVALSGATERLTRIAWSCDVQWSPPEVTVCDTDGNCTSVMSGGAGLRPLQAATLATTILTPTHGTVLTATTPISVHGAAYALNGLDALTVTVNGAAFHTYAWAGAPVSATWAATWTPGSDGVYRLEAIVRDTTGVALTETMPITVYVDTQAPAIAIGNSTFTTTHRSPNGMLALTGLVTDATGVQSVDVSTNGTDFFPATVSGNGWHTPWLTGQAPDGATYTVTARVSDMAGHTVTATHAATVDLVTPAWVTVTQSPTGTTVTPGTLTLAWTPSSDGSGLDDYRIQWAAQITETPRVNVTTHAAGGSRAATYPLREGQRLEATLISRDTLGNETWQPIGPIYGETARTPDFVTFPGTGEATYRGWMDLGCALVGSDTRIRDEADGGGALNEAQNFYVTWDTASLRMTWTGADWGDPGTAGDGDLFIYLDTLPGGSDRAYNPYTGSMSNTVVLLPARRSAAEPLAARAGGPKAALQAAMTTTATEQMQADYVVWVQDTETAVLLKWENEEWRMENGEWEYRFEREPDTLYTDLLVPFSTLSVTNPTTTALSLVAFASENDALRLWATMPARNALNSSRLLETQPGGDVQRFALTHRYDWPSLGLGLCSNGTQSPGFVAGYGMSQRAPLAAQAATRYSGSDIRLQLNAEPSGLVYSVLEDNLFYIMDDVFDEWMDWDDVDAELCEWFPEDPECEREGTPPGQMRLAPTQDGGVDFNAQDSLDILMDVDNPAVGNGDVITYTIHYANQGDAPATGLYAEISTWGPVRLPAGEYYHDDSDGSEYYWLELGPYDLAPGETLTLTFNGLIDTAFDPENSFGWATLDVIFYDDTGDIDDNQLDWFYVDHEVDIMPPGISLHAIPALIGPDENPVGGFISDRSAVPTVTLQILDDYEREDWLTCLDATPEDRAWACEWDAAGAEEGDLFYLTAYATDVYSQSGNWAPVYAWYTFTVDATPPVITLDTDTLAALSDGLIGPDELQLNGSIQDNRLFDTVEVCDDEGECDGAAVLTDAETLLETIHTYDDIPATPMPLGAGTLCESGNEIVRTFNVTEDFVVADVAVGLNISHEYRMDVDVWLIHPDGGDYKANILWYGTDAENYDVLLSDSNTIVNYADDEDHDVGEPYFENETHPDELLSMFYGLEAAGEWQLVICDNYAEEDDGAYHRSRLILTEATLPENTRATWDYTLSSENALDGETMTLDLFGEDSVGNRSDALALSFRVDTVAPVLTVTTALSEVLRGEALTLPVLAGLVSDGDGVDSVSLFGFTPSRVPFTQTAALAGGAWQATLGYTQTGMYDVWVHAEDVAGNLTVAGPYPVHLNAPPLLTKSVTPTTDVPLGSVVTYTLRLSNENDAPLPDVRLQDVLPAGVRPLTQTVGTVYLPPVGNTLIWGPYTMTRGATFQFVFLATVTDDPTYSGATLTNTAYVTSTNFGSAQAAAAFTLAESQLFISKTVATAHTPVQLGEAITYTVIVGNRGTGDAADVRVSDALPEGLGGDALQWVGALAAGEQRTFTLPAVVTTTAAYAGRTLTNTATLHYGSRTLSARAAVTLESGGASYAIHLPLVLKP